MNIQKGLALFALGVVTALFVCRISSSETLPQNAQPPQLKKGVNSDSAIPISSNGERDIVAHIYSRFGRLSKLRLLPSTLDDHKIILHLQFDSAQELSIQLECPQRGMLRADVSEDSSKGKPFKVNCTSFRLDLESSGSAEKVRMNGTCSAFD